ncbi:hypothetical protein E2156_21835 [Escherichia coli]|uniref:Uncharacterized protein n=1 Tax=Escherichia coli TaxID=562 RepID=A0A3P1YZ46_ECOLX|nr:hypothetical protein [Escherichia coli]EFB3284884.1 hypothetical protein [Escherichia coli]EFB3399276.1 hypothetical protein [Escherichia coli]EFB9764530.1 hypothetical protein [Escherichia coli]EFC6852203.1 hypothetical protein [Escherichia coli]
MEKKGAMLAIVFTAPGPWLTHRVSQSSKRVFSFCYFFSVIFTLFSNCLMLTCGVGNSSGMVPPSS